MMRFGVDGTITKLEKLAMWDGENVGILRLCSLGLTLDSTQLALGVDLVNQSP
jgi:hypothetical protein